MNKFPIKCMICNLPFEHYEEDVEEFHVETVGDIQSCVGQVLKGGITIFTDNGNYGSTILDCDGVWWTIMFHDECLKQRKKDGCVFETFNRD